MEDEVELFFWDFAVSTRGEKHVIREMRKSKSLHALARMERAMKRVEDGIAKPTEYGLVGGDIWELRVNLDNHWYRLLYARHAGRYVALFFGVKKTNKLDRGWIETAESRLGEHAGSK